MVKDRLKKLKIHAVFSELRKNARYCELNGDSVIFYSLKQKPKLSVIKNRLPIREAIFCKNDLILYF